MDRETNVSLYSFNLQDLHHGFVNKLKVLTKLPTVAYHPHVTTAEEEIDC